MLKKKIAFLLLINTFLGFTFATEADLKALVNPEYYDEFIKTGFVELINTSMDYEFKLVPQSVFKDVCIKNRVAKNEKNFAFTAEDLYLIKKQDIVNNSNATLEDLNIEAVSKVFRKVSTMKGLQYFSKNRKKYDILYKDVYMVDNAKDRNKIPDNYEGDIDNKTYYLIQDDVTFGTALYEQYFLKSGNEVYGRFTNFDPMGIAFVKAVQPKDMIINVVVIDVKDSFVFYIAIDTDCAKMINIRKTLENCLTSRMEALKKWFESSF